MKDKHHRRWHNDSDQADLYELIRTFRVGKPEKYTIPSEEAIWAYISGTATHEQENAIREALIASPDFRELLLDLIEAHHKLSKNKSIRKYKRIDTRKYLADLFPELKESLPPTSIFTNIFKSKYFKPVVACSLVVLIGFMVISLDIVGFLEEITTPGTAADKLAVMYFDNDVDDDPEIISEIFTHLLITDLSESEYVDVLSTQRLYDLLKRLNKEGTKTIDSLTAAELIKRSDAKWMLNGKIIQTDPNIVIVTTLTNTENRTIIDSSMTTGSQGENLFSIVDKLTPKIKSKLNLPVEAIEENDPPITNVTTESIKAYRYYVQGLEYLNRKDLEFAKQSFIKAIEYDSTFSMAYLQLANRDIYGSLEEKKNAIFKAHQHSNKTAKKQRLYIQSVGAYLSGNSLKAIESLIDLVKKYPEEKDAYRELGWLYKIRFEYDDAIKYYSKAISLDPFYKLAFNELAYTYWGSEKPDSSIWAINQYIDIAPDEHNPYDTRGDLYAWSGNASHAIDSYLMSYERKPDFYPSLQNLGHMYLLTMDYQSAYKYYQELAGASDKGARSRGRLLLSNIYSYQGKFEESLQYLNNAISADQIENYKNTPYLSKLFSKALLYIEQGKNELASIEARKFFEISRNSSSGSLKDWMFKYIHVLARCNLLEEADKNADILLISIQEKDLSLMYSYWFAKGWIELENNNPEDAIMLLKKGSDVVPLFYMRFSLALAYLKANKFTEAISEFEIILNKYSDNRARYPIWAVKSYYYLGVAYENSNRIVDAVIMYNNFLNIWRNADPGIEEVEDAKKRLHEIKIRIN